MSYKSSPRGSRPVSLLGVHTAEGARTARSLANYFYNSTVDASAHTAIDGSEIINMVPFDRAAWTMRSANPISENVELCGFARWTREQWLSEGTVDGVVNPRNMLRLLANWLADRCRARGIPVRKLTIAELAGGSWGIIAHNDWTVAMHDGTHWDPGTGFPWDVVIADTLAASGTPAPPPPAPVSHPPVMAWTLPYRHYIGDVSGPVQSHSGDYRYDTDATRALIKNAQQWLIYHNCVPGIAPSRWATSGWADGLWEAPSQAAMRTWHATFYPGQPYPSQCWSDDYARLARP